MDWDSIYRRNVLPPWSIGAAQPELAALIDQGQVRGDVLDAGCGHAELSLALAARGYTVVGLDASGTAIAAATRAATERGLTTASFARADVTDFAGYDERFTTVMDSGLLHALPADRRQPYMQSIHRAAAPGAALYVLAAALRPGADAHPGPHGFTEDELRDTVATLWTVDWVRPASLYANGLDGSRVTGADDIPGGDWKLPGLLLAAHKS